MSASNNFKYGLATLLAAVVAAGASTLCCLGPLLYLVFGVSAAGLIGIQAFAWLQIPMTILSLGLMACGFWRLYLSPRPVCVSIVSRRALAWLYWLCMPLILALLTYPWVLPWLFDGTQ